jgi:hypothetical protein
MNIANPRIQVLAGSRQSGTGNQPWAAATDPPLLTSEMQTQWPSNVSFQSETLLSPPETANMLPETDLEIGKSFHFREKNDSEAVPLDPVTALQGPMLSLCNFSDFRKFSVRRLVKYRSDPNFPNLAVF